MPALAGDDTSLDTASLLMKLAFRQESLAVVLLFALLKI